MKILYFILISCFMQQALFAMYPLHEAVYKRDCEEVSAVLRTYVQVNEFNNSNLTPLECAVMWNLAAIVKLLLDKNADPNKSFYVYYPPLWRAVSQCCHSQIVSLLLDHGAQDVILLDGGTLFHLAARNGDTDIVESFFQHGANVNCKNAKNGWTPLHYAADGGRFKVVQFLLERHANRNQQDNNGITPLQIAKNKGFDEITSLLIAWPSILCNNARLALLMGIHPRAGALSSLYGLSQPALRMFIEEYVRPENY